MSVRKVGNWNKAKRIMGALAFEMEKSKQIALKRLALKAEGLAKTHISKQDLRWTPLKADTIAAKVRAGYSENILVMTSDYFQNITGYVKDDTAYAGVKRVARNRAGQPIADIARVHEFGSMSGNIPARPLWQPVMKETIAWHLKNNLPEEIFFERMKKYFK